MNGLTQSPLADAALNFVVIFGPGVFLVAALTGAIALARLARRGLLRVVWRVAAWRTAQRGLKYLASYANCQHMRTVLDDLKPSRKEDQL